MSRAATRRWGLRFLQAALLGLVAWGVYRRLAPEMARVSLEDLARWRPALLPLAVSTVGLAFLHLAQSFLWRRIVGDLAGVWPNARATVRIYFVSGLGRYIPGSIWQVAGLAVLAQRDGVPPLAATASSILGTLAFLVSGAVFLAVLLPDWAGGITAAVLAVAIVAAALGLVVFLVETQAGARIRRSLARHVPAKLAPAFELAGRIRPRDAMLWGLGYGAGWLLLCASFTLFVAAFVPAAAGEARHLSGTIAASYLAGYVVLVAPAGIGVRESVMGLLLSSVIPVPAAVVVSVASRIWFVVAELLALGTLPFLPRRKAAATTDMLEVP